MSIYSIWKERNNRIFRKEFKPEEIVITDITNLIRSRIMSLRNVKNSKDDQWYLKTWNIHVSVIKSS